MRDQWADRAGTKILTRALHETEQPNIWPALSDAHESEPMSSEICCITEGKIKTAMAHTAGDEWIGADWSDRPKEKSALWTGCASSYPGENRTQTESWAEEILRCKEKKQISKWELRTWSLLTAQQRQDQKYEQQGNKTIRFRTSSNGMERQRTQRDPKSNLSIEKHTRVHLIHGGHHPPSLF
jgi:hypothetical protein